ncbi:hypothetical protein [Litoribacterium kuwaitense]|nr:hypothetical protein [Litoribacterium kuwaitense]
MEETDVVKRHVEEVKDVTIVKNSPFILLDPSSSSGSGKRTILFF